MKSHVDVSSAGGASLSVLRSSGAIGLALSILALGALHPASRDREPARSDLLALELGTQVPPATLEVGFPLTQVEVNRVDGPTPRSAEYDEFSFGPNYTGEPGGY